VPGLGAALDSPVANLRKEAAASLGEIGDRAALPFLDAHAEDPDPDVRKLIRWARGRILA